MGLFNLFKKDTIIKKHDEKIPYYGDLKKTHILNELFKIPQENRSESWKAKFLEHVADASFMCGDPQIIDGPDGFPYFQLFIPESNEKFECFVIRNLISDFILEKGIGIVISPNKINPDWVFTYGDLINFEIKKEFYIKKNKIQLPKNEIIKEEEEVLVGQPTELILPKQSRNYIREYLQKIGIKEPKVLLINRKIKTEIYQELVFNLVPVTFENNTLYEEALKVIYWYLPNNISFCSINENQLTKYFKPF